ncbi:MAG: FAD-dependent monooxygenase [Pseudomonadota bacterium]|nr:FAD-dependent monooxygenase [Pseudomonadota bacterium]
MLKISHIPVLVVGSGAAGTMLALELARHGIAARIVDRLPTPSKYSRAVTVHARTLEIFELIDPKLAQRYLERGVHSPGYVMHFVDDKGRRRDVRPGLDFRNLPSQYQFLLVHSQDETEATLRDYLREKYGCETEWGLTCTAVTQRGNLVEATLQDADGALETVVCQYLVACDGANSRIRQQLELAQEGSDYAGTVLQNLDIELLDFPDDDQWIHYCMGPAHFVMVAKMQNGFTRLLMSQPADKADANETPQSVFSGILAQHFDGIRFGKTLWHSRWASQVRLAHTYRKGNIFLAGDAAHVHSTAGGQGMNCCMQDAFNLGWKLALVLKEQARPELLDTYESERKPIGKQVIEAASKIHELFMAGRNSGADALLELQQSGFLAELVGKVSGLSYHYRGENDVAAHDGMPRAGDRMPNPALQGKHAGKSLSDVLRHGDFTLLLCAHDAHQKLSFPPRRGVVCEVLAPAPVALLPAGVAPQLYLVRPDGYCALRCAVVDDDLANAQLARIFH